METKKKIAVWCALFAFFVALVPTSSAQCAVNEAEVYNGKYKNAGEFLHDLGYTDFVYKEDCSYIVYVEDYLVIFEIDNINEFDPYVFIGLDSSGSESLFVYAKTDCSGSAYWCYKPDEALLKENYSVNYMGLSIGQGNFLGVKRKYVYKQSSSEIIVLWSDFDIYLAEHSADVYRDTSNLLVSKTVLNDSYTFQNWCVDAGLNCQASSSESANVIPYSYNDYWHIVRKTSSGKWLLTTVGNSVSQENASDYTFMYSEDMGILQVLNLYSGEDTNGYLLNVRQYEYDTDGWKVRTYETYDARETDDCIIDLGAGSGVDDTRVLAYTNVNIYDQNFELVTSASTEYVEPTTPESPGEEITPTPTNAPSGGGVGGGTRPEVTPAVSAGQATVVLDRTGIYEEPSTTSQLQHYLYSGALVYVVDELENGWYYVRYEVGGLSQVGYVYSENIDYSSENGYASDIVGGEVVEKVEEMLGMVKVVPVMISVLFSFLPPWCLAIVGVGFSLLIALIIYKCARG